MAEAHVIRVISGYRVEALDRDGQWTRNRREWLAFPREEADAWMMQISEDDVFVLPAEERRMREAEGPVYTSDDGWTIKREDGTTPVGNQFNQDWVLRDEHGRYVANDRYINDITERFKLRIR